MPPERPGIGLQRSSAGHAVRLRRRGWPARPCRCPCPGAPRTGCRRPCVRRTETRGHAVLRAKLLQERRPGPQRGCQSIRRGAPCP
eukprot:6570329-Alexandrium_andersonii.AAC.1